MPEQPVPPVPVPEPVFRPSRDGVCDLCSNPLVPLAQVLVVADQSFVWACEPCWAATLDYNQAIRVARGWDHD
jgi:hypothetical protein